MNNREMWLYTIITCMIIFMAGQSVLIEIQNQRLNNHYDYIKTHSNNYVEFKHGVNNLFEIQHSINKVLMEEHKCNE